MRFVAPAAGTWVFDTLGSAYDTVLYALDACGGAELACNDDFGGGRESEVRLALAAGQAVFLTVDGYGVRNGAWSLNATLLPAVEAACFDGIDEDLDGALDCADSDCAASAGCVCVDGTLTSVAPVGAFGSTLGAVDDQAGSCGGGTAEDVVAQWTAPAAGLYTFDTVGSAYDTVLYVLDDCGGAELACNDDSAGLQSSLQVNLLAGQSVRVVVDGFSTNAGAYVLNITP